MNLGVKQKQSLKLSLKLWLPLLQAPIQELETIFKEHSYENPFLEFNSSFESNYSSTDGDKRGFIENMSIYKESLYDKLLNQIDPPLFPTPKAQKVANEIINYINAEGYFEGDEALIAEQFHVTKEYVQSVRERFKQLEPAGVGAKDLSESFSFQLFQTLDIDEDVRNFSHELIKNIKKLDKYASHHLFEEAKEIIKHFNNPPAIEYLSDMPYIVPDFFVDVEDDIKIRINNSYYPDIVVSEPFKSDNQELKAKLKEAKDLVNLLELRKSTLYKLVLTIVEKQLGFFIGSELKPLTMAQVASELGFEESTISRAVSNKYIKCERGMFSLKSFFTNAVSKNLSSSEIKNYLVSIVENESHEKPLTDQDIVDMVMKRYNMKMVRRTITKYRKMLNIPSSKERKKIYKIS